MLTNGHVWYGYADGDHVPTLPLRVSSVEFRLHNPYTVTDASGYVIAAFRNKSDYQRFIKGTTKRHEHADKVKDREV